MEKCDTCGGEVKKEKREKTFKYGIGSDVVELRAECSTWVCQKCSDDFTDFEGEIARSEAVHNHLCSEIKKLKEEHDKDIKRIEELHKERAEAIHLLGVTELTAQGGLINAVRNRMQAYILMKENGGY